MAEQTYHQAGLQHLAHLRQDSEHQQVALVPQLQHQYQHHLHLEHNHLAETAQVASAVGLIQPQR
jgi:pyridoxine 5'-phosphate synthase PdxJ